MAGVELSSVEAIAIVATARAVVIVSCHSGAIALLLV